MTETRLSGQSERAWESSALQDLRRASEARGLTFYVKPPRKAVPDFLGNYQPDAIARGSDGGIIIQVKHRRGREGETQLAELSEKISRQKGWEFRVIYLNPAVDGTLPIKKPTWAQLHAALKESEALAAGGHHAAALVSAWAALEALARLASSGGEAGSSNASPLRAVQALAEEGFVENEVADRLRRLAKLRDAVVHGDLSAEVPADQVEMLVRDLRSTALEVEAA